ncbi:SH3 domain-containing protein [Nonomuraea fuscirosea]|uniref:SH3 domain-containing protein n=1 Tax=Nonomuraea fuscirosea TaxID=1291556 RepID=UPI003434D5C0
MGTARSWRAVRVAGTAAVAVLLAGVVAAPPALAAEYGTVATDGRMLNIRTGPSTGYAIVGQLRNGATVRIYCQIAREEIVGLYGPTQLWDKIHKDREWYVADALVHTGTMKQVAPTCLAAAAGAGPSRVGRLESERAGRAGVRGGARSLG